MYKITFYFVVILVKGITFSVITDDIVTILINKENKIHSELSNARPHRGNTVLNNLFLYTHHLSQLTFLVKHEEPSFKGQAITYYTKSRPKFFEMNLTRSKIKEIYDWRRHHVALMDKLLGRAIDFWNTFMLTFLDHIHWFKDDNNDARNREL